MRRRDNPLEDEVPEWWYSCVIELWSPVQRDPVAACLAWHRARGVWADARGLSAADVPAVRQVWPHFADGCHYSSAAHPQTCGGSDSSG